MVHFIAPFMVLTFLLVHGLVGVDRQKASFLLAIMGIVTGTGRILFGLASNRIGLQRVYLNGSSAALGGALFALSFVFGSYTSLAVYIVFSVFSCELL